MFSGMNNESEGMWYKPVVVYFRAVLGYLCANHEKQKRHL